jgi:hypothetical protein
MEARMRLPENFFTSLLVIFFADLGEQEHRESVLNLDVEFANGKGTLKDRFPFSTEAKVWMCPDLRKSLEIWDQVPTEEDRYYYGGKSPDVWCQDEKHILFIENKTTRGRNPSQEEIYFRFLSKKVPQPRTLGFFYCVPESYTQNRDNPWNRFIKEGDGLIERGLIKWNQSLAELLRKRLSLPGWFLDKLPH